MSCKMHFCIRNKFEHHHIPMDFFKSIFFAFIQLDLAVSSTQAWTLNYINFISW